jgi:hypothetical protein
VVRADGLLLIVCKQVHVHTVGADNLWFDIDSAPGWHDWLGLGITLVGFALTIFGLIVAYDQLKKTQTAAEAVNVRLSEVRDKLNGDQLAAVLPQLNTIVADMDFAIDNNDREVAHRALLRFSYVATETIALLSNVLMDHTELQERLRTTSSIALDIKGSIVSKRTADIPRLAKATSRDIGELTVEVSGIVAQARYQLGDTPSV